MFINHIFRPLLLCLMQKYFKSKACVRFSLYRINRSLIGNFQKVSSRIVLSSSQGPFNASYIPNEEERRVFRECNSESFWYRCEQCSTLRKPVMIYWHQAVILPNIFFAFLLLFRFIPPQMYFARYSLKMLLMRKNF